jgi:hypothetical protein
VLLKEKHNWQLAKSNIYYIFMTHLNHWQAQNNIIKDTAITLINICLFITQPIDISNHFILSIVKFDRIIRLLFYDLLCYKI